jgi:hypothetical protein
VFQSRLALSGVILGDLLFFTGRLPESGGTHVRRQSRHRIFRKGFGKPLLQAPETETGILPLYQLAGEIPRQMGPWDYSSGHETLPVVNPVLVAQVKFTEWTHDDQPRQPVFLGLRADKEAKDVVS